MTPIEEESKEDELENDVGIDEPGVRTKPLEFKLDKVTSMKSSSDVSENKAVIL